MSTLHINVGGSLAASRKRLLDAVSRREAGADVEEHHVTFDNWETFAKAMTPNRLELLRHVHTSPPRSILALAKALGRDYRRVHGDVAALTEVGLLERNGDGLRAEYDKIEIAL